MASNTKLRWGIISTARIGLNQVIPAIQKSSNGMVVAIASRDAAKAQDAARASGIKKSYGSYLELLNSSEVDAVYNPLPNSLHLEWTILAAEKGKHVLCEKPLALNAREGEKMISACERYGVRFMEAFMYRFHPQTTKLKEMVDTGEIGKLVTIRSELGARIEDKGDIRYQKELGGGALMDMGCYCVNVARFLTGEEPDRVEALANFSEEKDIDESLTGMMRFPNKGLSILDCSFKGDRRNPLEIVGTRGSIEVPSFVISETPTAIHERRPFASPDGRSKTISFAAANSYQLMAEHFADCVLNDHEPSYRSVDALNNMRVIDRLYESARRSQ